MSPPGIKRITLAGFKSVREAELDLSRVNVLIGANGAGKSNLASFLKLLRAVALGKFDHAVGGVATSTTPTTTTTPAPVDGTAATPRDFEDAVVRGGGANMLLHFGAKRTSEVKGSLQVVVAGAEAAYQFRWIYAPGDRLLMAGEGVAILQPDGSQAGSSLSFRPPTLESKYLEPGRADPDTVRHIFRLFEGCRVYHFLDTTPESRIRQHGDLEDNRTLHGDGRNLAAVLYKLQETRPEHYQLIVRTVRLVAPFFLTFSLAPRALNPRTIALRWRPRGSDEDFDCHQLSDGTLRFIALATLLLQPPEDLPAVIFIDEPELGLHPYAVSVLASLIHRAGASCQVIVATQSPNLLDHFDPEEVVVVEQPDQATTFRRLNAVELADWLQEYSLSELWEKNVLGGRPAR
jgi:predicted ATPase